MVSIYFGLSLSCGCGFEKPLLSIFNKLILPIKNLQDGDVLRGIHLQSCTQKKI